MDYYGKKMSRLIEQLSALPGIGGKSAQRLAFHIIHMPKEQVEQLTDAIKDARENICYCKRVLHTDRSGALSDLRESAEGSPYDHGSREHPRPCGL